MPSKELELLDRIEQRNKVVELYLKGSIDPGKIAKQLQMTRAQVLDYIDEYKEIARNDDEVKACAREALYSADSHISMLIEESWNIIRTEPDNKVRNVAIKNAADFEVKRVEMLQKAGLYDDAAIGDELAEMEEKAEAIKELLKQVAQRYPDARQMIMEGLSKIFKQPEPVVVSTEVATTPAS